MNSSVIYVVNFNFPNEHFNNQVGKINNIKLYPGNKDREIEVLLGGSVLNEINFNFVYNIASLSAFLAVANI